MRRATGHRILPLLALSALACEPRQELPPPAPVSTDSLPLPEEPVTLARARELEYTTEDWRQATEASADLRDALFSTTEAAERWLKEQIARALARRANLTEAGQLGLRETGEGRARLAAVERAALFQWMMTQSPLAAECELTETELRAAHAERQREVDADPLIWFQQIFLDLAGSSEGEAAERRALAEEIVEALRADPSLFEELARAHSQSSVDNPGEAIGPIGRGQIHPEIETVLWALDEGAVSDAVESPVGVHVFRVVRRVGRVGSFEDERAAIAADLWRACVTERAAERLSELGAPPDGTEAELLADLAQREGWADLPGAQAAVREARESALVRLLWAHRVVVREADSHAEARAFYESHSEAHRTPLRCRVRVLELHPGRLAQTQEPLTVREVLALATAIRASWEADVPFDDLVRLHSTAEAGSEGAEPQWVYPLDADSPYASLADLATGEVSPPVRLPSAYVLAQILGIERDVVPPFEELEEDLIAQRRQQLEVGIPIQWNLTFRAGIEWSLPEEIIEYYTD